MKLSEILSRLYRRLAQESRLIFRSFFRDLPTSSQLLNEFPEFSRLSQHALHTKSVKFIDDIMLTDAGCTHFLILFPFVRRFWRESRRRPKRIRLWRSLLEKPSKTSELAPRRRWFFADNFINFLQFFRNLRFYNDLSEVCWNVYEFPYKALKGILGFSCLRHFQRVLSTFGLQSPTKSKIPCKK